MDIPQDAFDELKMRVTGGMHMEANLLDGIRKIRASECEVLKCTGKTPIEGGVGTWSTLGGREFGLCIDWCRYGIAV
jgi:hypothetical protein